MTTNTEAIVVRAPDGRGEVVIHPGPSFVRLVAGRDSVRVEVELRPRDLVEAVSKLAETLGHVVVRNDGTPQANSSAPEEAPVQSVLTRSVDAWMDAVAAEADARKAEDAHAAGFDRLEDFATWKSLNLLRESTLRIRELSIAEVHLIPGDDHHGAGEHVERNPHQADGFAGIVALTDRLSSLCARIGAFLDERGEIDTHKNSPTVSAQVLVTPDASMHTVGDGADILAAGPTPRPAVPAGAEDGPPASSALTLEAVAS